MHNVGVALELKINQTNTSITIIKFSSAKLVGVRAAGHQRSSWAQPRAQVLRSSSSSYHADFRVSPAKP